MPVDFVANERHFLDHLAPVYHALPDAGTFYLNRNLLRPARRRYDIDGAPVTAMPDSDTPTVVAAWGDLKRARRRSRPVIYSEHGAGQTYVGVESGSYLDHPDRDGVIGMLVPGPEQAERAAAAHNQPVFAVGVPKLDWWHTQPAPEPNQSDPIVAVSFHWDAPHCPETRSSWKHYRPILPRLSSSFSTVIGHAHPQIMTHMANVYRKVGGFRIAGHFDDVLDAADVYVCDNSSTLVEFASTGRPVVFLNSPTYRRDVEHGGRFWQWPKGQVSCDTPRELVQRILEAAEDPPGVQSARRRMVESVYGDLCDGRATARAVDAVERLIE